MDHKEGNAISKKGLTNIFNHHKLSRNEALKKYQSLSQEAREEATQWINRAFYLETSFPQNVKLDPNNPGHSEYIENWLKHMDSIMSSGRDWEKKPGPENDTRILRENIKPTPLKALQRKEGIFENRLTPSEFKRYVINSIDEPSIYGDTMNKLETRRPIATRIASKLLSNKTWLDNATSKREGVEAMQLLSYILARNPEDREKLSPQDRAIHNKLYEAYKPHLKEIDEEKSLETQRNLETFKQSFPKLAEAVKTNLESKGLEVEKIYYRQFPGKKIEIRADTVEKTTIEPNTYGYRGDSYTPMVKTERKNISIGGFDTTNGVFLSASYFNKHGTAETDWDTQLALGELAVLAGVGIRALISGTRSIIINSRAVREAGKSILRREMKDTLQDLGDTLVAREAKTSSRARVRIGDDAVDGLGDTLRMRTSPPGPYNPNLARNLDKETINEVGENLATQVLSYGYHPDDLTHHISKLKELGYNSTQIRDNLSRQMTLADKYMDEFHYQPMLQESIKKLGEENVGNTLKRAILQEAHENSLNAFRAHDGNIVHAISTAKFSKDLKEWHILNDFSDGVANIPGHSVMHRIANQAEIYAKKLETEILGTASASGFLIYNREITEPDDQKRIQGDKLKNKENIREKIPKIREKKKQHTEKQKQIREKKT
jgi:hypothetical protein